MNINKHNVAMRWITRRRTNEVAGLYESFPGTFSAYQEALSSGFQGTMEDFIQQQSIPQSDRPFTGAVGGRVQYKPGGLVEPGVTHYARQTSAEKRATQYKKLLEQYDLPEGYWEDYIDNFYKEGKTTGKLIHVGGGLDPDKGIPYMVKKYGDIIKETYITREGPPTNLYRKVSQLNAAIKLNIDDQIESGLSAGRQIRKADLKAVGGTFKYPSAPKGYVTHHFLPKVAMEGTNLNYASTRNTAFIPERLNQLMSPYDTKLKANQKEQIKLLKDKPDGWEKKIEDLNIRSRGLVKDAARKIPGSAGYLGFSEMKITSEGKPIFETRGIDYNKSLAGLEGEEIFYKNISPEDRLKVKKMSNIKSLKTSLAQEKLAKIIERGPEGIKFLNKQAVAQTMWKAIGNKGTKKCSTQLVNKAGGERIGFQGQVCGLAFATEKPTEYMAAVKKDEEALNAFKLASQSKSKILKAARAVMRDTMNPVGWIGGELLISGGITAAMLGEGYTTRKAIDDGLAWFLPKSVLKSRLHEIEDMAKKEGVDFETLMPFFQLETIAEEHDKAQKLYLKNTDPLVAWDPQELYQMSFSMFGKKLEDLTEEELKQIPMPSAGGRGGKFYRQEAVDSSMAGMDDANRKHMDIVKKLREPFEEFDPGWVLPAIHKQELENIADMSQTERAKVNELRSLKKTYDRGIDLTVEGKRFIDKDVSFEDWVHKKGKGDLFFNEFQRGPKRREFLTHNLFNPVKQEPYKMPFPGRESIDFSAAPYATGGRVGLKQGKRPYRLSRRGFLQWLAGITGAGIAAGTGLIKLGKGAKTVAPKVTEEVIKRGADGMPTYIDNLIKVVQSKGVKNIVDSNISKYPDTVHSYKGVDVTQDAAGNIRIKSDKSGVATDASTGKTHEGIAEERHMQIERGETIIKDEGLETQKAIQASDEYIEGSVRPDMDGKMKDFVEGLDEAAHLEFKKIADEADTLIIKKASGGRVDYDNYLPDIEDID